MRCFIVFSINQYESAFDYGGLHAYKKGGMKIINPILVSIIIPVYNVKKYLCECLDSVINQTYQKLDIIVIDDGSTDGSEYICDLYEKQDSRIRVVHQKNKGLSNARNIGLKLMRGEIVTFLDSDDAYQSNMIETMVTTLNDTKADIAVCGFYICNTECSVLNINWRKAYSPAKKEVLTSKIALSCLINGKINYSVWNKAYRKKIFQSKRFMDGHVYEDRLIMPYLIENSSRIAMIDEPLVFYRKRIHSITSTDSLKNAFDWLFARRLMDHFIIKRIPSVFTEKQRLCFLNTKILHVIGYYLVLLSRSNQKSYKVRSALEKEIKDRKKIEGLLSIQSIFLVLLFKSNPRANRLLLYFYKGLRKTYFLIRPIIRC